MARIRAGISTRFGRQINERLTDIPSLSFDLKDAVLPMLGVGIYQDVNTIGSSPILVGIDAEKIADGRYGFLTRSLLRDEGTPHIINVEGQTSIADPFVREFYTVPIGKIALIKALYCSGGGTLGIGNAALQIFDGTTPINIKNNIAAADNTTWEAQVPIFLPASWSVRWSATVTLEDNLQTKAFYWEMDV